MISADAILSRTRSRSDDCGGAEKDPIQLGFGAELFENARSAQRAFSYAEKNGLHINWENPAATHSKLAIITQAPREFDFAESPWPEHFHYTGPFHEEEGREPISFPWEKLTGKPLIYASLGTLVNGLEEAVTQKVLNDLAYRDKARSFQTAIRRTRGLDIAANVIEQALHQTSHIVRKAFLLA